MFKKAFSAAAASEMPRRTLITRPSPSLPRDRLFARGRYVEALSGARTKLGKGRVLARLGREGVILAFFNILLDRIALGVGTFELQPHAGAGEIGIENAVVRSQSAIEQHMFDPDMIVKIFQMA
jgi:hypothetical protein